LALKLKTRTLSIHYEIRNEHHVHPARGRNRT
jgi:hypothetical protein